MGSTCLSLYFNGWLSPDFWYLPQDQFYEFLFAEAAKNDIKILFENKSKFLLVHSSSGHKHSLKEVLGDPAVTVRLADTKVSMCVCVYVCGWCVDVWVCKCVMGGIWVCVDAQALAEVKALDSFYAMLQSEPDRAYYG